MFDKSKDIYVKCANFLHVLLWVDHVDSKKNTLAISYIRFAFGNRHNLTQNSAIYIYIDLLNKIIFKHAALSKNTTKLEKDTSFKNTKGCILMY